MSTADHLTRRILWAHPDIRVDEVVRAETLARLPVTVAKSFRGMRIQWEPSRVWGLSFQLGDPVVRLGHRQGDHYAMHPEFYGISRDQANEALRINIEGSLLHELGHACLDVALDDLPLVYKNLRIVAKTDGPVSSYVGHTPDSVNTRTRHDAITDDQLHEMFAEAFRWFLIAPPAEYARRWPNWDAAVRWVLLRVQPNV